MTDTSPEDTSSPAHCDRAADSEPTRRNIRKWRQYLAEERLEADTYRYLARQRDGVEREILLKLSKAEERHEDHWIKCLGSHALPAPKASLRARIMSTFARMFGSIFMLAMMQRSEQRTEYDVEEYATPQMAADEHIHGEVVRALAAKQRSAMSGVFRAAVFGINDGLVSTAALVLGVIGAGVDKNAIIAAGIAGLLAGALSMGAGEYLSVHSQRELLEASDPDPESTDAIARLDMQQNELELVFMARGEDRETAAAKAQKLIEASRKGRAQSIDPSQRSFEEIGTGMKAALSSFSFFALGAFIPVFPFLLPISVFAATVTALVLTGISLAIVGSVVGLLSGANPLPKALRQLLIGYGAAAITYVLGLLFHTTGL